MSREPIDRRKFLFESLPNIMRSGVRHLIPASLISLSEAVENRPLHVAGPFHRSSIPVIVLQQAPHELASVQSWPPVKWRPVTNIAHAANDASARRHFESIAEKTPLFLLSCSQAIALRHRGAHLLLVGLVLGKSDVDDPIALCAHSGWARREHERLLSFLQAYGQAAQWCNRHPAPAGQIAEPFLQKSIAELEAELIADPVFMLPANTAHEHVDAVAEKLETALPGVSGFSQRDTSFFYDGTFTDESNNEQ